jgi:hypothetical protein
MPILTETTMTDPKENLRELINGLADNVDDLLEEAGRVDSEEEPELARISLRTLADALDHFPGLAAFLDNRCKPTALTY